MKQTFHAWLSRDEEIQDEECYLAFCEEVLENLADAIDLVLPDRHAKDMSHIAADAEVATVIVK